MIRSLRVRSAVAAGAALIAVGAPAAAQAARTPVKGGTTTIAATAAAAQLLADNGITPSAVGQATASGTTFSYPIARGWFNPSNLRAVLVHKGGLKLATSKRSVVLDHFTIVSNGKSAVLLAVGPKPAGCRRVAVVFRRHGHRAIRMLRVCRGARRGIVTVARLVKPVKSSDGTSLSATVRISPYTAGLIDVLAGKRVAHAGDVLGTATIAPTT